MEGTELNYILGSKVAGMHASELPFPPRLVDGPTRETELLRCTFPKLFIQGYH